jgi:signal transduction histidine kinase/ActR/RegA family two-component response regulator
MSSQQTVARARRLPSVSRPLQAVAVVVLLLIVAASLQQLMSLRNAIVSDTERQMARLDMVFAEQTGRAVETIDFIARTTVETLHESADPPPSRAVFEALLRRRIAGVRQLMALSVADLDGNVLYATDPDTPAVLPAQGLAMLAWHKAHPEPGLRISPPFKAPGGQWTALLTRPCHGPDGNLTGIVAANLSLSYFEDFYRAVELSENGAIILHLRDGTVLARYPHVDAAIGTTMADLPPFKDILAHSMAGTLLMTSPIDGSIRVTAIRALRAYPLAVMVSVDQGPLLADWRFEAWVCVAAAICAIIIVVGLLLLLAHRSRQVERVLAEAQTAHADAEQANRHLKDEMNERERAESTLRQSQRIEAIGQLTGGVAHDFNNLLTVVLGNVDLMLRGRNGAQPDAGAEEKLIAIRSAAERGATLTSHLLAFARRQPLMPRPANLNTVVTAMQDLLGSALGRTAVLKIRLAPDLWAAMVDPTQIELVILNLAINARDAMPTGGVITIETANSHRDIRERPDDPPVGDYVMVTVSDTGTGMTPEVKARAFEPFFTTKAPGSGSGLGLSQVFGTARQLGGGVHIETEVGHGTAVSVFLPRATTPAVIAAPGRSNGDMMSPQKGGGGSVLLVDDDESVRSVIVATLGNLGYRVREADGGSAALRILLQEPDIDILLTDLVMPGMNGVQLADAAQDELPDLPVVYISGYAEAVGLSDTQHRRRLVRKPFRPNELRDQIEAALQEKRAMARSFD